MKKFLKWLGISALVGVSACFFYSAGVAKGKDMSVIDYFKSKIEKPVEKPEEDENQNIVDVPEIEDEIQTEQE